MGGMLTLVKVWQELQGYDDSGDAVAASGEELQRDGIDVNGRTGS